MEKFGLLSLLAFLSLFVVAPVPSPKEHDTCRLYYAPGSASHPYWCYGGCVVGSCTRQVPASKGGV